MEQNNSEKEALPITKYDDMFEGATDRIIYGAIPLCPHCGQWSYYTTAEEEERGYSVCPFCWGKMYMPKENKNICQYCKHSEIRFKGRLYICKKDNSEYPFRQYNDNCEMFEMVEE